MTTTTVKASTQTWRRSGPGTAVLVGALCGLVWAASLRGWMVQLVGAESSFSWLTFGLVLLPGAAVGGLLGYAAWLRPQRTRTARWLALSPVLFATALLDPAIFRALITTGEGGGALMVVITALAGGFTLGARRWSVARVGCALLAAAGLLVLGFIGTMAAPLSTARGAWVCLLGLGLMLLLCLAAALPYPPSVTPVAPRRAALLHVAVGAVCGVTWAASLRTFMAEVAREESTVTWGLTFGFVLLPGLVIGALLGYAAHLCRMGDDRFRRRLAWSPMLFAAVLFSDPTDLTGILEDGIGGGALAVPLIGVLGGYAVCGRGRVWLRVLAGLAFLSSVPIWVLTSTAVGGPGFAVSTAHGLWAAILYLGLLAMLALGAAIPLRQATRTAAADRPVEVPVPVRAI